MSKELNEINQKNIEKICDFIIENKSSLNTYFFIGSGIIKYVNPNLKLWREMANEKFNGYLNLNNFMDLISIDFDYEKSIDEINEFNIKNLPSYIKKENKNNSLNDLWNTILKFNNSTNQSVNKTNIITTNHCNTIEKYFEVFEPVFIEEPENFLKKNMSILKIHNFNNEEKINSIDKYHQLMNDLDNQWYRKLIDLFKYKVTNFITNNFLD